MTRASGWQPVREAAATIASNAGYVLREVYRLDAADWRRRVDAVWREFVDASERIRAMATRGEADRMRHASDEIQWLETSLVRIRPGGAPRLLGVVTIRPSDRARWL